MKPNYSRPYSESVIKRFQEWRKKYKCSLRKIQNETGIHNSYLSQIETGRTMNVSYDVGMSLEIFLNKYKGGQMNEKPDLAQLISDGMWQLGEKVEKGLLADIQELINKGILCIYITEPFIGYDEISGLPNSLNRNAKLTLHPEVQQLLDRHRYP